MNKSVCVTPAEEDKLNDLLLMCFDWNKFIAHSNEDGELTENIEMVDYELDIGQSIEKTIVKILPKDLISIILDYNAKAHIIHLNLRPYSLYSTQHERQFLLVDMSTNGDCVRFHVDCNTGKIECSLRNCLEDKSSHHPFSLFLPMERWSCPHHVYD